MNRPKAFILDMNGTMIDDMAYHTDAWHGILNRDLGRNLTLEQVKKEMYGKNTELLIRVFGEDRFTPEEMDRISMEKEKWYQRAFRPHLRLIEGLNAFLSQCRDRHILLAIGTAAIPFNVDFVLDGLHIRHYFQAIVTADDVAVSKPHPATFLKCAELLQTDPLDCIVFEDAPKGIEAAINAGMRSVALTTMHTREEFPESDSVLAFIKDYKDPWLAELLS